MDKHWRYFLAIENEVKTISNYVEFDSANYGVYSIEIGKNIMASTQEVDVLGKQLCSLLDSSFSDGGINDYFNIITSNIPDILTDEVYIPYFGLGFTPFQNWQLGSPPIWWTANNKIKHKRGTDFYKANLENMLNSMSGLLLIIAYTNIEYQKNNTGTTVDQHEAFKNLNSSSILFELESKFYHAW